MKKQQMAAVVMGAAALSACGPAVVVQGFGTPVSPACLVDATSPLSPRGVLDVTAATRYASVIRTRTAKDATITVNEAEVAFTLSLTPDEAALLGAAAAEVDGGGGLTCDQIRCETTLPLRVPTVTAEAGVVDDERILLVSADIIPSTAGETLAAIFERARELEPSTTLDAFEAIIDVTLVDSGGGRSLPATFIVDLCRGCLAPGDAVCAELGAVPQTVNPDVCLVGQDEVSATCVCGDGTPVPDGGCP